MSNLFRKDALNHRSRALFGDVVLRGPIGSWILTVIILAVFTLMILGLFVLDVETTSGKMRVIDFLRSGGQ